MSVIWIRDAGLDGYPSDRSLICIANGHQLLQLQRPPADETERRAHGAGAIHMTFPQGSQGVGVVKGDATLLKVKAHTEPRRQWVGEARGWGGAVTNGVSDTVSMVTVVVVVVVAVLGQVDLTHPHSEEAERRSRVQGVLCSAVMAAVRVITGEEEQFDKRLVSLFYFFSFLFKYFTQVKESMQHGKRSGRSNSLVFEIWLN